MPGIYDYPQYYDIAGSWEVSQDIVVLENILHEHADFPVRRLLEPACGTGRYLIALARQGYHLTGYDTNPYMLGFARQRIETLELAANIEVMTGDMVSWQVPILRFDAAYNMTGSLGYLLTDQDILTHLHNTGAVLHKGGLYIVQLTCAWDSAIQPEAAWQMQQGNVQVTTDWRIIKEDRQANCAQHLIIMSVQDGDQQHTITEVQDLRLWLYQDIQRLIQQSGVFKLDAIVSQNGKAIPLTSQINGEMGHLYYVLKAV